MKKPMYITLDKAKNAKRESKYIEFKERFDIYQSGDWCEIIKDIVAMSNSGGGYILIGVKKDGTPSGWDNTPVLSLDPAQITDKIARYTGEQFGDFDIKEITKFGQRLAALFVHSVPIPMVFIQPGTYEIRDGKQKIAFGRGTVYFRHGAKSEPGNSKDLRECIEREIERTRKSWLGNIRKVVTAPIGYTVDVVPPGTVQSVLPAKTPVRLVDDPKAPAYRQIDPDQTHPYRRKDVVQLVNKKLIGRKEITPYDVLSVRRVHEIDQGKREFYYQPKFSSPQYSHTFVDWLVEQHQKNHQFFNEAREKYKEIMNTDVP